MVSISEAVSSVSWGDFIGYVLIFAAPEGVTTFKIA
jgi:hypothetical protein